MRKMLLEKYRPHNHIDENDFFVWIDKYGNVIKKIYRHEKLKQSLRKNKML